MTDSARPGAAVTQRTLYLLDDNTEFRSTAKWWLSGEGFLVVDFDDAHAAIEALKALAPAERSCACLLLDVRMPQMTGLQVHDALIACGVTGAKIKHPLPIVYMTGHADVPLAVQAMEKGAITFLEKPFEESTLESALQRAFESHRDDAHNTEGGGVARDPSLIIRLQSLSAREKEVMRYLIDGKSNKMIARELNISFKTVELHRSRIYTKMQADSAVHLTRMMLD
jgi:FixJ family two-component response regulator